MSDLHTAVPLHCPEDALGRLRRIIEHAAHLLPSQAPIQVFIHHNTLHAFEHLPFDEAVQQGSRIYGCLAYLHEDSYRQELAKGRFSPDDLAAVLLEDLDNNAEWQIGVPGTRYHLRLAMLQHPLHVGSDAELHWLIAHAEALNEFRAEVPAESRSRMVEQTRHWVMRDLRAAGDQADKRIRGLTASLFEQFDESRIERWSEATWQAFTLHLLWNICHDGLRHVKLPRAAAPDPTVRHRDLLLEAYGLDSDRLINDVLIRFCGAFVDQGLAHWRLPLRERGFFQSWLNFYRSSRPIDRWMQDLPRELGRIEAAGIVPLASIDESLRLLGVDEAEQDSYLSQTLLALPGWAGMLWQLETNAEWAAHPAPAETLQEYVAVRLILERLALAHMAREARCETVNLRNLRTRLQKNRPRNPRVSVNQRAFLVFQLAQNLGWNPSDLYRLSPAQWSGLIGEIEAFSGIERRRIYHLAFERVYRIRTLDAMLAHAKSSSDVVAQPRFQVVCCIDEREESFRRHLEEIVHDCETFGMAGFFGVAMYYRGVADAHYVPLCPVVIKPRHYVQEEVVYSFEQSHRRRTETRRALGRMSHRLHVGTRSVVGGALTAILGTLASIPLVMRVLFPRLTARVRRSFRRLVQPPPMTRLLLERAELTPGSADGQLGFSVDEMADIVERALRDIGLTQNFARLCLIVGHGSSSLNNPHRSAYDCGACGGGRGGPNARAFAWMANDPRVREHLVHNGLIIPRTTVFVGAFHNTCDESIDYFDLDRLPSSHHEDFEFARRSLDKARRRNAHERCRRFESAELSLSPDAALRHVEARAEDLSQVRSECGHATNAVCFVGRRARTKGLFLDRRTFLTSYDPSQDREEGQILSRILQAVVPVCAGISLEYYFCHVDPTGYGCGTKLPHNISALLGVMDGAASDLRPGLPWQMVEIHEPLRILFIIETTVEAMLRILDRDAGLTRLVRNQWIQLAVLDPRSSAIYIFRDGKFKPHEPEIAELPQVESSVQWYRGWRGHLGFASIVPENGSKSNQAEVGC